jgi:hypothetical protein
VVVEIFPVALAKRPAIVCVVDTHAVCIIVSIDIFLSVRGIGVGPGICFVKQQRQVLDETISMGKFEALQKPSCPG